MDPPTYLRPGSFISRTLTRKSGANDEEVDLKGPLGLNTLHTPSWGPINADIIFVHGLGGGSRSTWTKSGDPTLYWPKVWLSQDEAFQDIQIHSFGYDSNWGNESVLGVYDFANALLSSILDCPMIAVDISTPIIFLGHSMGGLVIKRAYLLAKAKQEFASIASRIRSIFFLATPHRGSDLAPTFSKILGLKGGGARPYVTDLQRNSLAIQSINDEFPQHCQDLQLYSFYETLPTSFGLTKGLVVEKDLAVLGYANERRNYLNANHRDVCKYSSPDDPNYRTVHNAMVSVLEDLRSSLVTLERVISNDQRRLLADFLGVSDAPEDDFMTADNLRMSGSCGWLTDRKVFQGWLHDDTAPIYCINAKPATGKTILSGKVVSHLRGLQKKCSFYFFRYGDKERSTITSLLLSMAWQMALMDEEVFAICLHTCGQDNHLSTADYRTLWRKLYLEGILKIQFDQTHYWVVDALDECKNETDLIPLLMKVAENSSIHIFLTSRNQFESRQRLGVSKSPVLNESILEEDSKHDISLYLDANMGDLPAVDEESRQSIAHQILEKSRGCFLWVSLVFQELKDAHTSTDVNRIMDEVPTDMNELYARIIQSMSMASHGKSLAKAILIWAVCSTRPLKTFELSEALRLDLNDATDNIEASIRSCCGQLVYVDAQSQVQMIHLTARDFLLHGTAEGEFAIEELDGHRRLLIVCLKYLNGDDLKAPRRRKANQRNPPKERSPFINYACDALFQHIRHLSWKDEEVLSELTKFFKSSNVLTWIEYIARGSDLQRLIQTGNALGTFLEGCPDRSTSAGADLKLLSSWAVDLVRLVMKFGINLRAYPPSIFQLIPPFCPPKTAPRQQFGSAPHSLSVCGLRAETWDDCLSTIVSTSERYSSLACSKKQFVIGCFSGKIMLFTQTTLQEIASFQHEEPVQLLHFGEKENILVSAGSKVIRLWNLDSKTQLQKFDARQQCMALKLAEDDEFLLGAMKDHRLKIWDTGSQELTADMNWTLGQEKMTTRLYRRPITAAFNMDAELVAIIYKGQDILLWDINGDALYDTYSRQAGAFEDVPKSYGSSGVRCLVFGNASNAHLLAAAYTDGELVLFDTDTGEVKERIVAFAHILACSADGSILATADPSGMIQLLNFDNLQVLYRLNSVEPGIQGLAFSGDGLRLLDIRGSRCRVWDPAILLGQHVKKKMGEVTTPSSATLKGPSIASSEEAVLITTLACHDNGKVFFCGKEDGSVYSYDVETGLPTQRLFSHAHGVSIVSLDFETESRCLSSRDTSSRIMIHKLTDDDNSITANEVLFDYRALTSVGQLLCEPSLQHVLVCSESSDMLWLISPDEEITMISSITYTDREPYRWACHPSNPDHLILITRNGAHIYSWQSLERLTGPSEILLEGSVLSGLSIRSITPCFDGMVFAATFSESNRPHSKSKLVLWNTSDFVPAAKIIAPVPAYRDLSDKVEVFVGTTGTDSKQTKRLVFLHGSNWVCTADLQAAMTNNFVRHFFFPSDWLSTNNELILEVTKNGDIILVRGDEVAVVKKGLLSSESMEEPSGALASKRPLFLRKRGR